MAISAKAFRIVVGFIRVAAVTDLSLGHLPLMRQVTGRTVNRRVGGPEMEFATLRMTRVACCERLKLLLLQMARCAGKTRHRSVRRADMTRGALPDHASPLRVTAITAQFRVLAYERPGVFEFLGHSHVTGFRHRRLLGNDRMAKLAVFADHLPV